MLFLINHQHYTNSESWGLLPSKDLQWKTWYLFHRPTPLSISPFYSNRKMEQPNIDEAWNINYLLPERLTLHHLWSNVSLCHSFASCFPHSTIMKKGSKERLVQFKCVMSMTQDLCRSKENKFSAPDSLLFVTFRAFPAQSLPCASSISLSDFLPYFPHAEPTHSLSLSDSAQSHLL